MFVYIEMVDSIQYQCECRHSIAWQTVACHIGANHASHQGGLGVATHAIVADC